jgi:hypothetical protein
VAKKCYGCKWLMELSDGVTGTYYKCLKTGKMVGKDDEWEKTEPKPPRKGCRNEEHSDGAKFCK